MSPSNRALQIAALDPTIVYRGRGWFEQTDLAVDDLPIWGAYNKLDHKVRYGHAHYDIDADSIGIDQTAYLVMLHELGHKFSPSQPDWRKDTTQHYRMTGRPTDADSVVILLSEIDAWQWAVERSLTPIAGDSVHMIINLALGSYFARHAQIVLDRCVVRKYRKFLKTLEGRVTQ